MMQGNRSAQITEGTLVLKIARLEQHLKILKKQQALSGAYEPTKEQLQIQYQLQQMQQVLSFRQ